MVKVMDKLEVLKLAFSAMLEAFCFSITPWVLLGVLIAWLLPAPKGAQSGDIVINVSQANGPK